MYTFSKVKYTITRYVKCFVSGISARKNLFKETQSLNKNAPCRSSRLKQMIVG